MNELSTKNENSLPAASREAAQSWLSTPFGKALLLQEARVVEEALDGLFGEQCLQLGTWGDSNTFLRFARTQRSLCIADSSAPVNPDAEDQRPGAIGQMHRLPVESESVDVVLLPHTLDYSDERSHAVLREADRVLRPHGHLVVLGFKPGGLWGLRRLVPGAGLPPGAGRLISDRRLSDWLQLLDMRIHGVTRYFFRWPLPGNKGQTSQAWESRGQRFWPELAACYMLTAQKRVFTLTPMKKPWRSRPKVVGGIVEPTTRVSRIRFDRNR
jgi:SAM-dependent methyltransferase